MKKISSYFSSQRGVTLIEILVSIIILSIIIISLLSMFVQSSRSNSVSKNVMDATYLAETEMEVMYNLINSSTSLAALSTPSGYTQKSKTISTAIYEKSVTGHNVVAEITNETNPLVRIKVKITNSNKTKEEAKMELLLSWEKQ